ncbi:CPBP family intramembrane glutamic endopeptidase, BDIM_20840 family [Hyphococcus luteus]|nr:CPBP family intramembrane glutamic endopeptidase [Marinicaulis flavus]
MHTELMLTVGQIGVITLLGFLGASIFRKSFRLNWFVGALLLYALYNFLLTRAFFSIPNFPPAAGWNWLGKSMSLAGMLVVASLPVFGVRRTGITHFQLRGSWPAFLLLALLCGFFFYMAVSNADGRDDWETIAFQWTMPGIDEEIFYRGVLLLAMNEAFTARVSIIGTPIGYGGLLTSILFGLAHGMSFGESGFDFDMIAVASTGAPSLLLLWMREKTGSVVLPIIGHNVANGVFTLF